MAEEEINYSSVVFETKTNSRHKAQKEEEIVYDEVKVQKAEQAADGLLADQKATTKHRHYQLMACCLGIFCVILLFSIIAVSVNFTSVISENNNKLTDLNNTLSSENERLRRDKDDQTVIIGNLTKEYNDSEMKIKNLTEENQQLKTLNILTEQIRNVENNVAVIQQIIAAYCPIKDGSRQCKPCLEGWEYHQSSCYAINNPDTAGQKTWEEAQENCRGKNSDLVVIVNEDEKKFIRGNSWMKQGLTGYWIGLRAEAGKWKWIVGSDLTEKSWITDPAASSVCVISVYNQEWKSVNCGNKNGWICKKAALSV